jgi:hypothetical protein
MAPDGDCNYPLRNTRDLIRTVSLSISNIFNLNHDHKCTHFVKRLDELPEMKGTISCGLLFAIYFGGNMT